jgi:hypothetical protein
VVYFVNYRCVGFIDNLTSCYYSLITVCIATLPPEDHNGTEIVDVYEPMAELLLLSENQGN